MLFVLGLNVVMISNIFIYKFDVIMFDFEDVVVLKEKDFVCILVVYVL